MSRFVKWAYSVGLFLAMCGVLVAGTYQYKDNLSIPYNINIFGCQTTASCTSMTLQDSSGNEIFTPTRPGIVSLSGSPASIGVNDGSDATQGAKADSAATNGFSTSSVIALLKGILNNVVTPITITGNVTSTPSASPQNVTVANTTSPAGVAVVNNVAVTTPTPLQVTLPASPVGVAIVSSPVNVTGNFTSSSPQTVNVGQVQNVNIASPSTYGVAPVGSVQGVNAAVTNNVTVTPPTPLQVTLPASPVSVGLPATPLNVTVGNVASPAGVAVVNQPTVVLSGSPVSVGLTAGSSPLNVTTPSPLNVTGSFVTSVSSPLGTVPFSGASPQNVTISNSPVSVAISTVSSPLNVTGSFSTSVSSPIGVNIAATTPINVTMASPLNVTGSITANSASPTNVNLDQINGQLIASPSTYGVAPVGSVGGINAFITNTPNVTPPTPLQVTLPASPVSVGVANTVTVTPPTPLQITLPASPISVGVANNVAVTPPTPLNVTVGGIVSPQNVTIVASPLAVTVPASPLSVALAGPTPLNITIAGTTSPLNTYGVAPLGSVPGVNAFVTNNVTVTPPTPLQITLPASPISVGVTNVASPAGVAVVNQPTVVLSGSPVSVGITSGSSPINVTAPSPLNVTGSFSTTVSSPLGVIPFNGASPQNVTIATSPLTVTQFQSPQSVVIGNPQTSGVNTDIVQIQGQTIASPSTYGVAPVGSTQGVNAFVTNGNANGSATSANSSPVVIASDQTPINVIQGAATPFNVTLAGIASPLSVGAATVVNVNILPGANATNSNIIAWTASSAFNVTNSTVALGATPGIIGIHQLNGANCTMNATITTPSSVFMVFFDATPHASGSDVALGTTLPKALVAIAGSPLSQGLMNIGAPGMQFTKGITFALVTTPNGSSAVGTKAACSFTYN